MSEKDANYYHQKWIDAKVPLEDSEYAVQMVNHKPYYFITNRARIFSVYFSTCKEKAQYDKTSNGTRGKARRGNSNLQLSVALSITGKKNQSTIRVSKLMSEYIPVSHFNPTGGAVPMDIHHIYGYCVEKGRANNYPEYLQLVDRSIHRKMFTPLQNSQLTPDGMAVTESKRFRKSLAQLGEQADQPFAIFSEIDPETGKVTGVHGAMLDETSDFYQQALSMAQYCYMTHIARLVSAYIDVHPEQIRVQNGQLTVVGDIDTSTAAGAALAQFIPKENETHE